MAPGQFVFTQTNYVVGEGDGYAILTVVRTNGHTGLVSVNYATSPGTATSGVKYISTNGVLNFASGETSKSIAVAIIEQDQVVVRGPNFLRRPLQSHPRHLHNSARHRHRQHH